MTYMSYIETKLGKLILTVSSDKTSLLHLTSSIRFKSRGKESQMKKWFSILPHMVFQFTYVKYGSDKTVTALSINYHISCFHLLSSDALSSAALACGQLFLPR